MVNAEKDILSQEQIYQLAVTSPLPTSAVQPPTRAARTAHVKVALIMNQVD